MVGKLIQVYKDLKIRNKIIIIYLPLIILPLMLVVYTSNYIFTSSIIDKTKKNINEESKLIITRIEGVYSNAETCANVLSRNIGRIYDDLNVNSKDPIAYVLPRNKISSEINYALVSYKDIESSAFVDLNSNVISSYQNQLGTEDNIMETELIKKLYETKTPDNIWFPMQVRDYLVTSNEKPVLTIGKRVISANSGDLLGFLILNIKENTISSVFPDYGQTGGTAYYITDKSSRIISSSNKQDLLKPIKNPELQQQILLNKMSTIEAQVDDNLNLVTMSQIKELDGILVSQTAVKELTSDINTNSLLIFLIGILCVLLAFFITFFLSRFIANPIIKLTNTANEVKKGNMNISNKIVSNDEVGILASVFNDMIKKISGLLEKTENDQKKKREYELALVQSQIKPHFLYNTIETINMFIRLDMKENALKTTESLANFYRISLSKGNDIISIREEAFLIESYLSIQKFRYVDYMDYDIKFQEEILNYNIPKLTLQPLVENAIYHGLKQRKDKGYLSITGYNKENFVIFEIFDNGVGMSNEKMKEILEPSDKHQARTNFGISSVNARLKLLFGDEYGLELESEINAYTKVTVKIAVKEG